MYIISQMIELLGNLMISLVLETIIWLLPVHPASPSVGILLHFIDTIVCLVMLTVINHPTMLLFLFSRKYCWFCGVPFWRVWSLSGIWYVGYIGFRQEVYVVGLMIVFLAAHYGGEMELMSTGYIVASFCFYNLKEKWSDSLENKLLWAYITFTLYFHAVTQPTWTLGIEVLGGITILYFHKQLPLIQFQKYYFLFLFIFFIVFGYDQLDESLFAVARMGVITSLILHLLLLCKNQKQGILSNFGEFAHGFIPRISTKKRKKKNDIICSESVKKLKIIGLLVHFIFVFLNLHSEISFSSYALLWLVNTIFLPTTKVPGSEIKKSKTLTLTYFIPYFFITFFKIMRSPLEVNYINLIAQIGTVFLMIKIPFSKGKEIIPFILIYFIWNLESNQNVILMVLLVLYRWGSKKSNLTS